MVDSAGKLYIDKSVYSAGDVIAFSEDGDGDGGGSGSGGLISQVYSYANLLTATDASYLDSNLTNSFNAYTGFKLFERIKTLENGTVNKDYVDTKIALLVDSSPATLDTLNELANALGDDPNFATSIATQIGNKQDSATAINADNIGIQSVLNSVNATNSTNDSEGNKISSTYTKLNDVRLTDARVASDVYLWAKQVNKPVYSKSEIGLSNVTNEDFASTRQLKEDQRLSTTNTVAFAGLTVNSVTNTKGLTISNGTKSVKLIVDVNGKLSVDSDIYSSGDISAYGVGGVGGGSGSGLITQVFNYSNLGNTFLDSDLTNSFNAFTINKINTRLVTIENTNFLTGITSKLITDTLGFTPYNNSNPNGFITIGSVPTKLSQFSNDSNFSTVNYVDTSIANLIGGAPTTLNTLDELAQAMADDANMSVTLTNLIGTKQNYTTAINTANIASQKVDGAIKLFSYNNPSYYLEHDWNGTGWNLKCSNTNSDEQANIHLVHINGSASYATTAGNSNTVGGRSLSFDATANSVVVRDGNGYIYGGYINSNRGIENSVAESYIYDIGDGWMRKKTLANVKAEIVTSASVINGLGYTSVNRAGDTMTGTLTVPTILLTAPAGDPSPIITVRTVPISQGGSQEKTELILFHSNDNENAGVDQITLRAPALNFQTYNYPSITGIDDDNGYHTRLYIDNYGNSTFSGNITATQFNGSAAGLTGSANISVTHATHATDATNAFGIANNGDGISGFGVTSNWDSRSNGNRPFALNYHTGITISAHSVYGGTRIYSGGYPDLTSSVLRMQVTDTVSIYTDLNVTQDISARNFTGDNIAVSNAVYFNGSQHYFNWIGSAIHTNANFSSDGNITAAGLKCTGVGEFGTYNGSGTANWKYVTTLNYEGVQGASYLGQFRTYTTPNGALYKDTGAGALMQLRAWDAGSSTEKNIVTYSGNGNTTFNGNITAAGEITAFSTSDKSLKKNIKTLDNSLDIINQLNPVSYNWNDKAKELNPNKTDAVDVGVIAQELEIIIPELIHNMYGDENIKGVDYIKLIPYLIGAIQELTTEINKLKNK